MSTHHDNQHSIDPRVLHVTTLVALIGSIIVAILPPALQFYYAAQLERGSIVGEAFYPSSTSGCENIQSTASS